MVDLVEEIFEPLFETIPDMFRYFKTRDNHYSARLLSNKAYTSQWLVWPLMKTILWSRDPVKKAVAALYFANSAKKKSKVSSEDIFWGLWSRGGATTKKFEKHFVGYGGFPNSGNISDYKRLQSQLSVKGVTNDLFALYVLHLFERSTLSNEVLARFILLLKEVAPDYVGFALLNIHVGIDHRRKVVSIIREDIGTEVAGKIYTSFTDTSLEDLINYFYGNEGIELFHQLSGLLPNRDNFFMSGRADSYTPG